MNKQTEPKYEVTRYDGHEVEATTMAAEERDAIDPKEFDHLISTCSGTLGFRDQRGSWIEHHGKWPRMGPVCIAILRALQLNPGDFLDPRDIGLLTGNESLYDNNVLAARVCAIIKAHNDATGRFIETRTSGGYAVRWPGARTWVWIDRIPARLAVQEND